MAEISTQNSPVIKSGSTKGKLNRIKATVKATIKKTDKTEIHIKRGEVKPSIKSSKEGEQPKKENAKQEGIPEKEDSTKKQSGFADNDKSSNEPVDQGKDGKSEEEKDQDDKEGKDEGDEEGKGEGNEEGKDEGDKEGKDDGDEEGKDQGDKESKGEGAKEGKNESDEEGKGKDDEEDKGEGDEESKDQNDKEDKSISAKKEKKKSKSKGDKERKDEGTEEDKGEEKEKEKEKDEKGTATGRLARLKAMARKGKEAVQKLKDAVNVFFRILSGKILKQSWMHIADTWGITFIYVTFHFIMKYVSGSVRFSKFGTTLDPMFGKGTPPKDVPSTASEMIEKIVFISIWLGIFFLILGTIAFFCTMFVVLFFPGWIAMSLIVDALKNLIGYFAKLIGK